MNKVRIRTLAYVAGIIDGEGSICILRCSNKKAVGEDWYYQLRICVKMTDGKVIDFLQGNWHGCVMFRERQEPRMRAYEWVINGTKAASFLKEIMPFLIGKKEQAELGISFQAHRKQGKRVNHEFDIQCQERMKWLHHNPHDCAAVETKQKEAERLCDSPPQ